MTPDDLGQTDGTESTRAIDRLANTAASSTYKVVGEFAAANGAGVLGKNTAGSGTPIGVEGAVPNASGGYGLSTPDGARVEGDLEATSGHTLTVGGDQTLHLGPSVTPDSGDTPGGNVVAGFKDNSANGNVGVAIGGGGSSGSRTVDGSSRANTNEATGDHATVGGGENNRASTGATVGGGVDNTASGGNATVGGGYDNTASGSRATVGGGVGNTASGTFYPTVAGGNGNTASDERATVGGGENNEANARYSTVAGGDTNVAGGKYGFVGGGQSNSVGSQSATVAGGSNNDASGYQGAIGGGSGNTAAGTRAAIAGGGNNSANAIETAIGGGDSNVAHGGYDTIAGGRNNRTATSGASGYIYATVGGGRDNVADGKYSFAAGRKADTNGNDGAFVWGDSSSGTVTATRTDEVVFQATGGFVITSGLTAGSDHNVNIDSTTGELLDATASSVRYKTNVEPLETDTSAVLELSPRTFDYEATGDSGIGFIAESVEETVPELVTYDREGRPDGVKYHRLGVFLQPEVRENRDRLDTVQREHDARIEELEDDNEQLRSTLAASVDRIAELEAETEDLRWENEQLRERLSALEARVDADAVPADD